MSIGDWIIIGFVALIFFLGIYGGIKLFRWNKRDHENMEAKNKAIRENQDK